MIRTAFDPFAPKPSAGDQPAPLEHGKVYVCGSTEHAAGGHTGPSPTGHGHHHQHRAPLRTPHLLTTLLEAQVMQISCGGRHSALVLSDGELYACGNNEYGKCGFGDTTARTEPTPVPIPLQLGAPPSHVVRVAMVSCGRSHTGFVCTMGELYTYGLGLYGQLGHQSLANQLTPLRVEGVGGAANSVSCGGLHTLVVRADGRALSCGFNDAGCLGRSLDTGKADEGGAVQCSSRLDAVLVSRTASSSDAFAVISAAAGGAHSTLVLADGSVYTCGRGECGQLGHGSNESEAQPRRITALKGIRVRRAACGQAHTLLLTSAGVPYACGGGSFGKLGLGGRASVMVPTPLAHLSAHVIVQISAGDAHSSFVSETGKVFLCGDDGEGQLGLHRGSGGVGGLSTLLPQTPAKLDREGVEVLGASCGGLHTAFVLRAVVDAKEDYREDQKDKAAATIEAFFRGAHVRAVREAKDKRQEKLKRRSAASQAKARRDLSVRVIQSQWRIALRQRAADRNAQLERMRGLHDPIRDVVQPGWGRAKAQLDAALVGAAISQAVEGANKTKASW